MRPDPKHRMGYIKQLHMLALLSKEDKGPLYKHAVSNDHLVGLFIIILPANVHAFFDHC